MPERLHKALAAAGLGSRREIEEWIRDGRISVNGVVASLGQTVTERDRISIDRKPYRLPRAPKSGVQRLPRVLLYNKPEGELVTRDDPEGRPSVFSQLPRLRGAKWIAIGRLDINTSGLLLFTTGGELANRMMHPSYEIEREYAVRVMGVLTPEQGKQLVKGVPMEDGIGKFDRIEDRGGEGSNHWYHVILREGRKREVRRIFQAVGLMVSRLIRVRYGGITLPPRVKRGQSLELEAPQVQALLKLVGLTPGFEARTHYEEATEEKPRRPRRDAAEEATPPKRVTRAAPWSQAKSPGVPSKPARAAKPKADPARSAHPKPRSAQPASRGKATPRPRKPR